MTNESKEEICNTGTPPSTRSNIQQHTQTQQHTHTNTTTTTHTHTHTHQKQNKKQQHTTATHNQPIQWGVWFNTQEANVLLTVLASGFLKDW